MAEDLAVVPLPHTTSPALPPEQPQPQPPAQAQAHLQPQPPLDRRATTQRSRIQCKQEIIVTWLQEFYSRPGNLARVLPVLSEKSAVSLRLVDWFVTNFAKKHNVAYMLGQRQFLVYFHYKRELKAYSKRVFDPFCRRERILFQARGHEAFVTTIGQLNFFRWALEKGILDYVEANREAVETDMNRSIREHYGRTATSTGSAGAGAGADAGGDAAPVPGKGGKGKGKGKGSVKGKGITDVHTGGTAAEDADVLGATAEPADADADAEALDGSDPASAASTRSSSGRRRRSELSKSALKKVNYHQCNVVVSFS